MDEYPHGEDSHGEDPHRPPVVFFFCTRSVHNVDVIMCYLLFFRYFCDFNFGLI